MNQKASYPAAQAAALLDDQSRSFATDDYLLPFLQLAQDSLEEEALKIPDLSALTSTVIIPDVAAFTTDLSDYFASPDGALVLLTEVIAIKERPASGTRQDTDFQPMTRVRDIPTITPGVLNSYFSFDGSTIKMVGADQVTDIRIFGKFKQSLLRTIDDPIPPGTASILAFGTAALVAQSRGNDGMYARYEARRIALQAAYIGNAILEMQNVRTRLRSYSGRGNIRT